MKDLSQYKRLYFLGIGGIGMSALARYFHHSGAQIFGYDIAESSLTKKLEAEGMIIHYDIDVSKIPENLDVVIYTPAIPDDHAELVFLRNSGLPVMKRAEMLGIVSRNKKTIAIAGTHGKTTTSSMLSHILKYCGLNINAFLGGILESGNTNFIAGDSDWIVVEADEFDRSFLHLEPDILAIMSLDADHLDVYRNVEEMYHAYAELTKKLTEGGTLILAENVEDKFEEDWRNAMDAKRIDIKSLNSDFRYSDVHVAAGKFRFDFSTSNHHLEGLESALPGEHNIINASVSIAIAKELNCADKCIREAVANFEGIRRRFKVLLEDGIVLIDDYAHHPGELKFALQTARSLYPDREIIAIFQPHLFSRTLDFYREFAEELEVADEAWLLPIYPARELPINGVQSEMIYNLIRSDRKKIMKIEKLADALKALSGKEVVMTLGASDIDKHHEEIIKVLKEKS